MAVPPGLALDLTRLFASALRPKPRGIDRVEMLYARKFLTDWPGECLSVLSSPLGARVFPRRRALIGLDILEAIWGEKTRSRLAPDLLGIGVGPGRPAARGAPARALYLNVGHLALSLPSGLAWLDRRPDVTPVFMLHDLIPVDHPEFVSARESAYFNRILSSLRRAKGLIFNTQAVAAHPRLAMATPRRLVAPLPLATAFLEPAEPSGEPEPYVLAVGEIEPRKNFTMLAEAWRALGDGVRAPRLVIVGAPGEGMAGLTQALAGWDPTGARVSIRHDVSTKRLRDLIAGAAALFAPSHAEGYGLAVAEGLAQGTGVVASDIPAHREVAQDCAVYLPPGDTQAWATMAAALAEKERVLALRRRAATYRPVTAEAYFRGVEAFLLATHEACSTDASPDGSVV